MRRLSRMDKCSGFDMGVGIHDRDYLVARAARLDSMDFSAHRIFLWMARLLDRQRRAR